MRLYFILPFILSLSSFTQILNDDFKFKEGIYMSKEEFDTNSPSLSFDDCYFELGNNSNNYYLWFRTIKNLKTNKRLNFNKVFGVGADGYFYLNYISDLPSFLDPYTNRDVKKRFNDPTNTDGIVFRRLELIGKISASILGSREFDDTSLKMSSLRMVILKHGLPFYDRLNVASLKEYIQDDEQLYNAFLNERRKKDKLLLYINRYNERNTVVVED